jgi:hypothetical protein
MVAEKGQKGFAAKEQRGGMSLHRNPQKICQQSGRQIIRQSPGQTTPGSSVDQQGSKQIALWRGPIGNIQNPFLPIAVDILLSPRQGWNPSQTTPKEPKQFPLKRRKTKTTEKTVKAIFTH